MKFLLINGSQSTDDTTKRLIREAKRLFDTVLTVPLDKIIVKSEEGVNKLFYKNTDLTRFDACFPRLFGADFIFGQLILEILEESNVYIPGSIESFQLSNHKYYTLKQLSKISVPIPTTTLSVGQDPAIKAAEKTGYPLVVKLLAGYAGKGVMKAQSEAEFKPLLDTMEVFKEFVSSQEYVEGKGQDIRNLVFGERVITIRRSAKGKDWRSNVSIGGTASIIRTPKNYRDIAVNASKIMGSEICAVDMIETPEGPVVVEVNFTPGIMEKLFKRRLAKHMVEYIHKRAREETE